MNNILEAIEVLLKNKKENEWVEFKVNNSNPNEIGERISALSNSACLLDQDFGYLIYGIEDKSFNIVGTLFDVSAKKIGNEELENWLIQRLNPRIDFKIHAVEFQNKKLIAFEIPAAINEPVKFQNISYIRIGSITRKLFDFPDKERKIWQKNKADSFENNIALQNVDDEKIFELLDCQKYYELQNQRPPSNKKTIIENLLKEKIVVPAKNKYNITNLGAILFAKDISNFDTLYRKSLRVIIYKGRDKLKTIREMQDSKGYAVGFEGLINFINSQLPSNEEIGTAFRKEVKIFPEIAIRELVANALIHQDFSIKGTGPLVEIFSDRIEITNPGQPLIETLRFIDHLPQSRNELIAHLMRRMYICEERGSGIDKVVFECEFYQLPAPNFVSSSNFFKAILYAPKPLRQMGKQDKTRACYQHACLKFVSNDIMTNQSLRERFKIEPRNYPMVSRIIADTIKEKLIKDFDPDNKSKKFAKYIPFWA